MHDLTEEGYVGIFFIFKVKSDIYPLISHNVTNWIFTHKFKI
jgi:hypothetical protein